MKSFSLQSDGTRLAARLFLPHKSNHQAILFIHGWRSNQDSPQEFAERLTELGYTCLTFDLGGMGQSGGNIRTMTRRDYLNQCLVAYDHLNQDLGLETIHAVGSSFGSYMSCILASERHLSSLVLRVPANYFDTGFDETPQYIQSDKLDSEKWDMEQPVEDTLSLRALEHFDGNVLVVESGKDTLIRPETVAAYVHSVPKTQMTHTVMNTAPHSITSDPKLMMEFQQILVDWFTENPTP